MFKTILAAADGSRGSDLAVRTAAELARASGASLTICHVFHIPEQYRDDLVGPLRDAMRQDGSDMLSHAVRVAAEFEINAQSRLLSEGHPAEAIIRFAGELGADLVVLGARGKSTDGSREIGSVGSAVVAGARSSVLIVRRPAA
jgi:nucleotide-binding universal stress UspA family protein